MQNIELNKRDFFGYGKSKPKINWPDNNKLALSIVVNIEEGAELSVSSGDSANEHVYENNVTKIENNIPDLCMESHFEYGLRSGFWRIIDLLDKYKLKATFSCCSQALEKSPWLIKEILTREHEISAHSIKWISHSHFSEDEERKIISQCYDDILKLSGKPPLGWHTRSATSLNTRKLLIEHGGFLYDSNAYNDDLPYLVKFKNKPFVVIPYAFDTNDMRFESNGGFVHSDDFFNYCKDAFDQLLLETKDKGLKMMSIGLHPRIIGRPGRINGLKKILEYVSRSKCVWVSKREDIAKYWVETKI